MAGPQPQSPRPVTPQNPQTGPAPAAGDLDPNQPIFYNPQPVVVTVFDEQRHRVDVHPIAFLGRHPDANAFVTGEHYRQFATGQGASLAFLDPDNAPPEIRDRISGAINRDRQRLEAGRKLGDPTANRRPGSPPQGPARPVPDQAQARAAIAQQQQPKPGQQRPGGGAPPPYTPPPNPSGANPALDLSPPDVVLDVATKDAIDQQFPDETPQTKAELAAYVLKRRGGEQVTLPPFLADRQQKADTIADEVSPSDGDAAEGDPENPDNTLPEAEKAEQGKRVGANPPASRPRSGPTPRSRR